MDINKMRNIVILKDLPSNLVEEAFVVLKKNQRIKNIEYADKKYDKFSEDTIQENDEFIVKEAELIVSDYINKIENDEELEDCNDKRLLKKYKLMKLLTMIFGVVSSICCMYILNYK